MRPRYLWTLPLAAVVAAWAAAGGYTSARQKFDLIESDRLKAGSQVQLSEDELNAYVTHEAPDGVRNPKLKITGPGLAKGTALVDFVKLRRSQGQEPGWLTSNLLDGERPVAVTAKISSSNGKATVDVQKVEISGMEIQGGMLDFLIRNVLMPLYPEAAVGRPFDLSHRIQRVEVQPQGVSVVIGQ